MLNKKIIDVKYNGECICKIAEKYNTTVIKICELNNIQNIAYIEKGRILKIEVDN